jgi:hypothetical protein
MDALLCYVIRMRSGYLPKFAVALLVLTAVTIILSGQVSQVAAKGYTEGKVSFSHPSPSVSPVAAATSGSQDYCSYYGYYNSNCSSCSNYGYGYSYYDCYYGYYGNYGNYGMYGNYGNYYGNYGNYYSYGYPYYNNYYYNTPSQYQLTVATDPTNLGTITGGGTYSQGSSASFSVTQTIVQSSSNTRYLFSHWSGDYTGVGSSGTLTMNGAMKVTAVYQLQYYLSVSAQAQNAPVPEGAGWYNAGDSATLTSGSQMLGDSSSRLVFQGWSVDGQSTQAGSSLSVKMDAPHNVSAQYKQQYNLQVLTDQGVAYGEGWYDAGSTAQIYVSTPVSTSYGVNIIFNGWQGDIQSNSQTTTVQMDKPKTAIASWRTDSTVLYLTIALGIIAVLVAGAIIAFAAVGRGREHTSETHTKTSETHTSHPNHTKKKTEEETKKTNSD